MNKALHGLEVSNDDKDCITIFLVDEINASQTEEQYLQERNGKRTLEFIRPKDGIFDWSNLRSHGDNLDFFIALNPRPWPNLTMNQRCFHVVPPADTKILCRHLTEKHRNCVEIAKVAHFCHTHETESYACLDPSEDRNAEILPKGRNPLWVRKGPTVSDAEVLNYIKDTIPEEMTVTLLLGEVHVESRLENLKTLCHENELKWNCLVSTEMFGREDQCVILLDCPGEGIVEYISRAINMLIIITSPLGM